MDLLGQAKGLSLLEISETPSKEAVTSKLSRPLHRFRKQIPESIRLNPHVAGHEGDERDEGDEGQGSSK